MRFVGRAWLWLKALLRTGRSQHDPAWVTPGNTVTRAIESGRARTFPPAPGGFRHRPVTLADYPDLALALRELAAEPLAPPVQAAPPPPVHPDRPAADRRQPSVSTRSARRRRHHRAA